MAKYPLSQHMPEKLKTKTGKAFEEITVENIKEGQITSEDIKISRDTLLLQGEIAEAQGKKAMQKNFIRASELVELPDALILKIYNALRPHRSTKSELLDIAAELKLKYQAEHCAKLVLEAAEVYEKRGILRT